MAHQMTPMNPNRPKAQRQDMYLKASAIKGGVKAPPQRAKVHMMPCARTRSRWGSQMVMALVRHGKQPASPAPNRKRIDSSETQLQAWPVMAVKALHHSTVMVITFFGPSRSPNQPPGTPKSA